MRIVNKGKFLVSIALVILLVVTILADIQLHNLLADFQRRNVMHEAQLCRRIYFAVRLYS